MENLSELFEETLRDTLDAEKQLLKALPKLAKASTDEALSAAFEEHKTQTEGHVERLEKIFKILGKSARGKHCPGMEGLITEGSEIIKEEEENVTRDAALIAAAQKCEHYEISAYGTLSTYAKLLGFDDAVEMLEETLAEEEEADEKLSELASNLNLVAAEEEAE